jgi:hypothetical protein
MQKKYSISCIVSFPTLPASTGGIRIGRGGGGDAFKAEPLKGERATEEKMANQALKFVNFSNER